MLLWTPLAQRRWRRDQGSSFRGSETMARGAVALPTLDQVGGLTRGPLQQRAMGELARLVGGTTVKARAKAMNSTGRSQHDAGHWQAAALGYTMLLTMASTMVTSAQFCQTWAMPSASQRQDKR